MIYIHIIKISQPYRAIYGGHIVWSYSICFQQWLMAHILTPCPGLAGEESYLTHANSMLECVTVQTIIFQCWEGSCLIH